MVTPRRAPLPTRRGCLRTLSAATLVALVASLAPSGGIPLDGPSARGVSPPQVLVLQPNGPNGTDASIVDITGAWNYGDNASLWVGPDPANGSIARSLLKFGLGALPSNATILNAALDLYQYAGGSGIVEARRATAPWTEGTGEGARARRPPARPARTQER